MIRGEVSFDLEPIIDVQVRSPDGRTLIVRAAIDTGFSDYLTLPSDVLLRLGLPLIDFMDMVVADNSVIEMAYYETDVIWDGYPRTIYVQESEAEPLVGMKMIEGYHLGLEAIDGGEITLSRLSP